jgi:lipopolysaccharide export system protein LptA
MTDTSAPDAAPVRLAQAGAPAANPPAVEARPPAAEATPEAGPGLLNIESGHPLSITADELEAIELPDGRRQLLFNRSVNVEQGGLLVRSNRLEAHYAAKATQPDRLVASGNVRVKQKSRELSCAKATYFPGDERLECVGNAQLLDGSNRVNGDRIEILFAQDRIRVKGGAVVNVVPDEDEDAAPPAAAEAAP